MAQSQDSEDVVHDGLLANERLGPVLVIQISGTGKICRHTTGVSGGVFHFKQLNPGPPIKAFSLTPVGKNYWRNLQLKLK